MMRTLEEVFSKFVSVLLAFVKMSGAKAAAALVIPCCQIYFVHVRQLVPHEDLNRLAANGRVSQFVTKCDTL
jgi:hypothetical protein